jgi:hypothetical protein
VVERVAPPQLEVPLPGHLPSCQFNRHPPINRVPSCSAGVFGALAAEPSLAHAASSRQRLVQRQLVLSLFEQGVSEDAVACLVAEAQGWVMAGRAGGSLVRFVVHLLLWLSRLVLKDHNSFDAFHNALNSVVNVFVVQVPPIPSPSPKSRHLESRGKAAARLDLEVSVGWARPSSRGLWAGVGLHRRCWKPNPLPVHAAGSTLLCCVLRRLVCMWCNVQLVDQGQHALVPLYAVHLRPTLREPMYTAFLAKLTSEPPARKAEILDQVPPKAPSPHCNPSHGQESSPLDPTC